MKQIQGQDLKKVRIGQAIVSVCGPGDSPTWALGERRGVVLSIEETRWGVHLNVVWDDGRKDTVLMLKDPSAKGIGVYAYPSLENALL